MDTRWTPSRLLAIMLASALALPASAGGLYKSVDADGAIVFSDVPPPSDARIVAQVRMGGTTGMATAPGMPYYEFAESDGAVARANARVDLAEHGLALARQGLWSPHDGLRLAAARMTQGDKERVAFYKKGVQVARQQLMDLLRERRAPMELAAR
jgi:hypothetical protein